MKAVHVLVGPKDWMRCPVCGDTRHGRKLAPAKYRGKMRFDKKVGKMVCNKCEFSFAFKDLRPKKEFYQAVAAMDAVAKL